MNFNIEVRKKQLESLDQYITSSKDRVESILGYLGWNAKKVLENESKVTCPSNHGHHIPLEKVENHVENCRITSWGYSLNEKLLSEPMHHSSSSIILDNRQKVEVLNEARNGNSKFKAAWNGFDPAPLTSDRIFSTFSPDERLALYDYCVKHTEAPLTPSEFDINVDGADKKADLPLTQEEELSRERNAKRRRIKYKSVHTGHNKSYTEVIREVINNQMDMYQEHLKNKANVAEETQHYSCYEQQDQIPGLEVNLNHCHNESCDRPTSSISRHSVHSEKSYNAKQEHADSDGRYESKRGRNKRVNESRKYREYDKKRDNSYERYSSRDSRREKERKVAHRDYIGNGSERRSRDSRYRSERRY